jgi:hypothetical protein
MDRAHALHMIFQMHLIWCEIHSREHCTFKQMYFIYRYGLSVSGSASYAGAIVAPACIICNLFSHDAFRVR